MQQFGEIRALLIEEVEAINAIQVRPTQTDIQTTAARRLNGRRSLKAKK